MLGLTGRPFAPDLHAINLVLQNQPGQLARVLVLLSHHNVNIEHAKVRRIEGAKRSEVILGVSTPSSSLDLLEKKISRMVGVLSVEAIPTPLAATVPSQHR